MNPCREGGAAAVENDSAASAKEAGMRMRIGLLAVALSLVLARSPASGEEASTMKIRLTFDGKAVEATLRDNATARDFLSLLPMTLTLEDYNATEKIGYPPRKLSTAGAPGGVDPSVGDIAYYAHGATWRSSTRTSATRKGSSGWAGSIRASRR
jgi:hypothetical protein